MGLTRQYLRYVPGTFFNVIGSQRCNLCFVGLKDGEAARYVAVGACENVYVWDLRLQMKVLELNGEKHEANVLCPGLEGRTLAVGYADGCVRVFDLRSGECLLTLQGHRSGVTALVYDHSALRLASGSKDTSIVMWDTVSESGQFKLLGHKGPITQVEVMRTRNVLVSSSKDCFVKLWDLDTCHCFRTLLGHRSEVWGFLLVADDTRLITACSDSELRVWKVEEGAGHGKEKKPKLDSDEDSDEEEEDDSILSLVKAGSIMRRGRDRVTSLVCDPSGQLVGCHGADSTVELFWICGEDQAKKRLLKRAKKERKKRAAEKEEDDEDDEEDGNQDGDVQVIRSLRDEVMRLPAIKVSSKVKSLALHLDYNKAAKVGMLLNNNSVLLYSMSVAEKDAEASLTYSLHQDGHRTDVRTVAFTSDDMAMMSVSPDSLKVWNRLSMQCIRTISNSEYGLSCLFVPGDRHAVVSTKGGKLQVFDIPSAGLLEEIEAHEGEAWTVSPLPGGRGFVSGGADKMVKFWDYQLVGDIKQLSVVHTRTLQMDEGVLCVKVTDDHRLIAVALLDSTVKIFFVDTLKFFLSLYGHHLPVLSLSTSTDSTLAVTGGADRHIKIWSLNFGECLGSLLGHDDSITCVQFVPKTHLFFSCGKDGQVKQWDADRRGTLILTLEGHRGECWSLAVSNSGRHVLSAGHDRSLRLWQRTAEPLVLEDQREEERAEKDDRQRMAAGEEATVAGEDAGVELARASRKTLLTEKAAERLLEGLDVYKDYSQRLEEQTKLGLAAPEIPALMAAYEANTPELFMLAVLRRIKSSELEEALLVLPFSYVETLLRVLRSMLTRGWEIELANRCLFFLLRIHCGQIVANHTLLPVIDEVRTLARSRLTQIKDNVGFNLAGLTFLQRQLEEKESVHLFQDAMLTTKDRKRKRKKKERLQKAHALVIHQ